MNVITAEGLIKVYRSGKKEIRALDGVDLAVEEGTVLGLLGPNGAGKTTAVRVLTTLLKPDGGNASVAGFDVVREPQKVRSVIGLSGQYAAVDENLTGRENLWMFGVLYQLDSAESRQRASDLLEQFELADAADRVVKTYSGGMRRRLDLASALIGRPSVLFMDEPTTGLDPRGRVGMWDVMRALVKRGTTLLLTTQYLEEADELADTIVVLDRGKVIARGTSDELKREIGGERVDVVVRDAGSIVRVAEIMAALDTTKPRVSIDEHTRRLSIATSSGADCLLTLVRQLAAEGIEIDDIGLHRPSLDDVFLMLTGHAAEAESDQAGQPQRKAAA
jgi:ABC-2 type transport system ATP-binding protein